MQACIRENTLFLIPSAWSIISYILTWGLVLIVSCLSLHSALSFLGGAGYTLHAPSHTCTQKQTLCSVSAVVDTEQFVN